MSSQALDDAIKSHHVTFNSTLSEESCERVLYRQYVVFDIFDQVLLPAGERIISSFCSTALSLSTINCDLSVASHAHALPCAATNCDSLGLKFQVTFALALRTHGGGR